MSNDFVRDEAGLYHTPPEGLTQDSILVEAERIVRQRYRRGRLLKSPADSKELFRVRLAERNREVFACLFLDARHRVIAYEELFYGTLDGTAVHPREIAKRALELNAGAVLFGHNHPSGMPEPSEADKTLTNRLKTALALLDVRVLDHLVVGVEGVFSFAEHGHL
jgi:DNA repair protein RadC